MLDISAISCLAKKYDIPIEDVLFIALNVNGVRFQCDYNRMRMAFRLAESKLFDYAKARGELDYYFALAVNPNSEFILENNVLYLGNVVIGDAKEPTEDICDSHYPRRKGTVLNINPNSRTSCRGCQFCYTAYQVPYDREKLKDTCELRKFFENWMHSHNLNNLSHLIQIAVVTGCYDNGNDLCQFLIALKQVLSEYSFNGEIFYLGSQINSADQLESLVELRPFSLCFSLEAFERRDLLRDKKRNLTLKQAIELMDLAAQLNFSVSFSYIVGLESLDIMGDYFKLLASHVNKFPIINTLQMHKYHQPLLISPEAHLLEYFLKARQIIERIFSETNLRPLVWEDYRSLWFLTFNKELLRGIRTP